MPIRITPRPPLRYPAPLPRDYPKTDTILVIDPPYTGERLTAILHLVAEAIERGEDCPITVLTIK